jgi:hypothetical protein
MMRRSYRAHFTVIMIAGFAPRAVMRWAFSPFEDVVKSYSYKTVNLLQDLTVQQAASGRPCGRSY